MNDIVKSISGYLLSMFITIMNYPHWPAISIIAGIVLTVIVGCYHAMKIYDQYLITKLRKQLMKHVKLDGDV